jgi:KaiC/GvpD/RAD55 family RecA-like ATPase
MTAATTRRQDLLTGIESLDDNLDGGLYPGSAVALVADPTSQSEIILAAMTMPRPTCYLTLRRSARSVRRSLSRLPYQPDATVRGLSGDEPFETALEFIENLDEPTTVIIDPVNELERLDPDELSSFLNSAGDHLLEVGGLLVLHCLRSDAPLPGRETTTSMADVVFDLRTDHTGELIENYLVIPKVRSGKPIKHPVKLELTDEVRVDTSRDIA